MYTHQGIVYLGSCKSFFKFFVSGLREVTIGDNTFLLFGWCPKQCFKQFCSQKIWSYRVFRISLYELIRRTCNLQVWTVTLRWISWVSQLARCFDSLSANFVLWLQVWVIYVSFFFFCWGFSVTLSGFAWILILASKCLQFMALKYLVFFCCSQYSLAVRVNLLVFCVFCEIYNFLLKVHLRLVELTIKLLFFECRIIRRFIYLLFFNPRKKNFTIFMQHRHLCHHLLKHHCLWPLLHLAFAHSGCTSSFPVLPSLMPLLPSIDWSRHSFLFGVYFASSNGAYLDHFLPCLSWCFTISADVACNNNFQVSCLIF